MEMRERINMDQSNVSIIIPIHNAQSFIGDTILSVKSQTYANWELILVDDHSSDRSVEFIQQHLCDKIQLFSITEGTGAAATRNEGLRRASGRYITFLDADDLWDPRKLELQLAFMEEKGCAFSFTGYEYAGSDGVGVDKIVSVPSKINYEQALRNTTIFTSTVMFDTDKISKKLIEMPQVPSEDTATWWKILRNGYTAYGLNIALTLYRRSQGTLSSNKKTAIKRIWNLYRNVEKLNIVKSAYCFAFYALHAVWRRL